MLTWVFIYFSSSKYLYSFQSLLFTAAANQKSGKIWSLENDEEEEEAAEPMDTVPEEVAAEEEPIAPEEEEVDPLDAFMQVCEIEFKSFQNFNFLIF